MHETILATTGIVLTMAFQTISLVLALRGVMKELIAESIKAHNENIHAHAALLNRNGQATETL